MKAVFFQIGFYLATDSLFDAIIELRPSRFYQVIKICV